MPLRSILRAGDIANMGFAQAADVPVVLIADIDRGGVIASVVGTHAILQPEEVARVRGYIINKFRGDPRLFDSGVEIITRKTGWPCLGVVPWFQDASKLPAEDAVAMQGTRRFNESGVLRVAVPVLSRIANFDDFDPLIAEPQVSVNFVAAGEPIPADIDLVILPGSKSTIGDLNYLREQGWHIDIAAHVRRGGAVLGICGGYQMLGNWIDDPNGIEGPAGGTPGLGLLDVKTVLTPRKTLEKVSGTYVGIDASLSGYEIHIGETGGPGTEQPMMTVNSVPHGARAADGLIEGCYLHGMFERDAFRKAYLSRWLDGTLKSVAYERQVDETLNGLANHLKLTFELTRFSPWLHRQTRNERPSCADLPSRLSRQLALNPGLVASRTRWVACGMRMNVKFVRLLLPAFARQLRAASKDPLYRGTPCLKPAS